jgi:hypothetical protein
VRAPSPDRRVILSLFLAMGSPWPAVFTGGAGMRREFIPTYMDGTRLARRGIALMGYLIIENFRGEPRRAKHRPNGWAARQQRVREIGLKRWVGRE